LAAVAVAPSNAVEGKYIAKVTADAPVGYWPLNETVAGPAHDEVGTNQGSASGGVTIRASSPFGAPATSRAFDGNATTQATQTLCTGISLDPVSLRTVGDMTVEAWVNTKDLEGVILRWRWYGYSLRIEGGKAAFDVFLEAGGPLAVKSSISINDGIWHHVVGTKTTVTGTSTARLYIDGNIAAFQNLPSSATFFSPIQIDPTAIGRDGSACDGTFASLNGTIAHVAVYGKALSPTAVLNHRNPGLAIPPAAQVGSYAAPAGSVKDATKADPLVDPVNSITGGFDHAVMDLGTPGSGVPLEMDRTYDSRQTGTSSLGPGWWHPYFESVSVNATSGVLTWRMPNGGVADFVPDGVGGFATPPGFLARVTNAVGGGWEIKLQDQTVDRFDTNGRLVTRKDRSGQGVAVVYDSLNRVAVVTDATLRTLTFAYGASSSGASAGMLTSITASDGRVVSYGYTFVSGANRLSSFTDLRAKVTTYTYDVNGFLKSQFDPLMHSEFTNVYDSFGRVVDQADALGFHSTFVYDDFANNTIMTDASGAVQIIDRTSNLPVSHATPAGTSIKTFNDALDLTSFTDANGRVWTATYDATGNMLTRTSPAPFSYVETWTYDAKNNPLTYKDARGFVTTSVYDTAGRLTKQTAADGGITTWTYDVAGRVLTTTDPLLGVVTNTYDAVGNLASTTDQTLGKTTYTYDAAGRVLTMVEPRGNVIGAIAANFTTTYTYDAAGHVLTTKDALARITTNTYDNAGNLATTTAADGGVTTYGYNAANELVTITAPDGGVITNVYDNRGLKTSTTDQTGGITTYTYDGSGRMITMVEPRGNLTGAVAALFTTTYEYDALGHRKKVTDPEGKVTTMTYDQLGRMATITDPLGTTTYTYDQNGNVLLTSRTGIGNTSATYDTVNRRLISVDARGKSTTFTYDLNGNQKSVVSALGNKTTFSYDKANRILTSVDPRGNVTGAIPANFTTTHTYDVGGYELTVKNPLGQIVTKTYNPTGQLATVRNPKLNTTSFTYDLVDRIKTVVAPSQGTTTYAYNTAGRLTTRTDGLGHITTYTYDLAGRLKKQTDPLARFTTFDYDVSGNKIKTVDGVANLAANPLLGSTTVTYDNVGRRTKVDYSDTTPDVTYTYDTVGRAATMSDGFGTETYAYDAGSRLSGTTRTGSISESYGYINDANGNVMSRTLPDGTVLTFGFDDDNRLATVTKAGNGVVTSTILNGAVGGVGWRFLLQPLTNSLVTPTATGITFVPINEGGGAFRIVRDDVVAGYNKLDVQMANAANKTLRIQPIRAGLFNGPEIFVTLDANGFASVPIPVSGAELYYLTGLGLTSVTITSLVLKNDQGAATTTYTYDAASLLTKTVLPNGTSKTVTYDGAARVASIALANGVSPIAGWTYVRDLNGNPTSIAGTGTSVTAARSFGYDTADRLTSTCFVATAPCPAVSAQTFTYDAVGNRKTQVDAGVSSTYTYDVADQLTLSVTGAVTTAYTYDGNGSQLTAGTRVSTFNAARQTTSVKDGTSVASLYAYDGGGNRRTTTVGVAVSRFSWDSNGGLAQLVVERDTANVVTRSYVNGLEPISASTGLVASYFSTDEMGSVTHVTSGTGATQWVYNYAPFGTEKNTVKNDVLALTNSIRFTGQYVDPTNNYNLRARYHNPSLGTFTQTDPLPGSGSQYVYGLNLPVKFADPSGRRPGLVTLIDDVGPCPGCAGSNRGSRFLNDWTAPPFRGTAIEASGFYGVDPRLVYGVFIQETDGLFLTQSSSANINQLLLGVGNPTVGPTNLTIGTIEDILKSDPHISTAVRGASARDIAFWISNYTTDPSWAAGLTASRLKSIEIEVRAAANAKHLPVLKRKDFSGALGSGSKGAYLSSVIGAGNNAQAGDTTEARAKGRGQVINAFLSGDFSNTTPAVANNSGNPNLYKNQYTDAMCRASGQINGGVC
jgi:RHS repeat-associated protein